MLDDLPPEAKAAFERAMSREAALMPDGVDSCDAPIDEMVSMFVSTDLPGPTMAEFFGKAAPQVLRDVIEAGETTVAPGAVQGAGAELVGWLLTFYLAGYFTREGQEGGADLSRLLGELRAIAADATLPDGDGVTVPVSLWAEGWLARLAPPQD